MPSAASFRRAFGLEEGASLPCPSSGWAFVLEKVHVGHVEAQRHARYLFPTELHVSASRVESPPKRARLAKAPDHDAAAALRGVLETVLGKHHIVNSAYGSPYDCRYPLGSKMRVVASEDEGGLLRVTAEGSATRRRDIPTAAQAAAARLTTAQKAEIEAAESKAKQAGLRIVSSRFGTSTCAGCGKGIDPGARIARPSDVAGKGGWKHVACAV